MEDMELPEATPELHQPSLELAPMDLLSPPLEFLLHSTELDLLDHPENATVKPSTTALLDLLEKREFPDTMVWMDILDWTVLMVLMPKMPKLRLNNTKDASLVLKDLPDLLDNLEDLDLEE